MLALLYGCGLRRSEAVALERDDYDAGAVTIRRGKGRKERIVYCPAGGREAIDAWIERRGAWSGALLCPVKKGGHVQQRTMTAQAVLLRLRFLSKRANVTEFSPHDLRRSFVGELLDAGADISSVQQLAGHASVQTTQRYDRRPEEAKRRTAEMLHVPYTRPRLLVSGKPAPAALGGGFGIRRPVICRTCRRAGLIRYALPWLTDRVIALYAWGDPPAAGCPPRPGGFFLPRSPVSRGGFARAVWGIEGHLRMPAEF